MPGLIVVLRGCEVVTFRGADVLRCSVALFVGLAFREFLVPVARTRQRRFRFRVGA